MGAFLSAYDDLIENNTKRIKILEEMARLLYRKWFENFRFPGHEKTKFINSKLGRIPEGWDRPFLEAVCTENGMQTGPFGSQHHQSDYVEAGPVVMPKVLLGFRVVIDDVARIDETMAEKLGRHRMAAGDTVCGRRGDIGRRAFIARRQEGWLCGTGCLRSTRDLLLPRLISGDIDVSALRLESAAS